MMDPKFLHRKMLHDLYMAQQQAQMQNAFGQMYAPMQPLPTNDWRMRLGQHLVKIANDLNLAYIDPTLSAEMIRLAEAGEYTLITAKYIELLKYYGISKDMVTL